MDWIITLPRFVQWEDYQRELDAVADGDGVLSYRVSCIPKGMVIGDRMFLVWRGQVRGWMGIHWFGRRLAFKCQTTGTQWPAGYYIQRSGKFHHISNGPLIRGFQGVRRYQPNK